MIQQSRNNRKIGSVGLSADEVAEMEKMDMNPSQYLAFKLRGEQPKTIHLEPTQSVSVSPSQGGRSVEDAITIAKQEAQIEQLKTAVQQVQSQHNQGLGAIEMQINERMDKFVRDREFADLKKERDDYKSKFENSEKEKATLEESHNSAQSKLGMMELVKEFAPLAQPILAGLGRGIESAKTGGLGAFFSGFGNTEPVDPAREEADEIAGYLADLFSNQEREQIKQIISTFHADKSMISRTIMLMQRLLESQSATPAVSTEKVNETPGNTQEESASDYSDDFESKSDDDFN